MTNNEFKLPPQNIEIEMSLLSSLLLYEDSIPDVMDILKPDDFYKTAHKKIYECIVDIYRKSEKVDLALVADGLKKTGKLEEVGGGAYLSKLCDEIPLSPNHKAYAKIVKEKSKLRYMINTAIEISNTCYKDEDSKEAISIAESFLFKIAMASGGKKFKGIKELLFETIEKIEASKGSGFINGVPTGFRDIDSMTGGLQKTDLILIAARPSMGKTSLALDIARNATSKGIGVAIFSLEMSNGQLSMRMLSSESGVGTMSMRQGFLTPESWRDITRAASRLSENPIFINDSPDISVLDIRSKMRSLAIQNEIGLVIIDYLQIMKIHRRNERHDLEIGEISKALKSLAKELDIPVIALSQLNRKVEDRADKRPQLSDLRESGALEQDADVVMFIYRDEVYNKEPNNPNRGTAEIIIAKQRNGPTGTAKLVFNQSITKFSDIAKFKL
jgi:replicative DNA helicase